MRTPLQWARLREAGAASSAPELERPDVAPDGKKSCPTCDGSGVNDGTPCDDCDGSGWAPMSEAESAAADCPTCDGSGKIRGGNVDCPDCGGSGKASAKAKEADVQRTTREAEVLERLERLEREVGPLRRLRESKPGQLGATYSNPTRVKTTGGQEGYLVDLIKEGKGNAEDDRWYPAAAIKEMCESRVAEGMQAYADHPDLDEEEVRPERSVRHLVGHYRDVRFAESGGKPRAEAVFVPLTLNESHPTYGWVVTLAEAASKNTGPQPLCGISLYGYSACDMGSRPDGSEGPIATLIRPTSGDIVTNAGAGGGFIQRVMESARAHLRHNRKETRPMRAEVYTQKVAEATKRLREADSDETRNAAIAELEQLQEQTIDAPPKPVDTVEQLVESAPKLVEQIREATKREAGQTVEQLQTQLREVQDRLSSVTDVIDLSTKLSEAGVTDETELRYFAGQAKARALSDARDIKDMVEAERAYHKKQEDALDEKLREATAGLAEFDVEGAFAREPAGDGAAERSTTAMSTLREAGVPIKTKAAA